LLISPYLIEYPNDDYVENILTYSLIMRNNLNGSLFIREQDFKTIAIQLKAYGLIKIEYHRSVKDNMALFWSLTKKGERLMMENRVVRRNSLEMVSSKE